MKRSLIKINIFLKGLILLCKPHVFLNWMAHPLLITSNIINLSKWISKQEKNHIPNDFYSFKRDYSKRYEVYQHVMDTFHLKNEAIHYVEFGVCQGESFRWWAENNLHDDSRFYGFDTFEGLPEDWGVFKKGDMSANIPVINDDRITFFKGLFQDTLPSFLSDQKLKGTRRNVIHMDADLFTSTLYALTSMAPYLKSGDIIMFDEFNVPNHEFYAFKMFSDAYRIETQLICAVNNYYQIALEVK